MEVHVGQRGEIVIPKKLRERYGIKPGHTVQVTPAGTTILIRSESTEKLLDEWSQRVAKLPKLTCSREELERTLAKEPYEDED